MHFHDHRRCVPSRSPRHVRLMSLRMVLVTSGAAAFLFSCQPRQAAPGGASQSDSSETGHGWVEPDSIALKGPHVLRDVAGLSALAPPTAWIRAQGEKINGVCGRFQSPDMYGVSGERRVFTRVSFDSVSCAAVYAVGKWSAKTPPGGQDSLSVNMRIRQKRDTNP